MSQKVYLATEGTHERIADALDVIKTSQSVPLASETTHERIAVALEAMNSNLDAIKTSQSLPIATSSTLGGVKIGNTLEIDSGGKIDYNLPIATSSSLGGVKIGNTLEIDSGGAVNYNLPAASASVLGGVKLGGNIELDGAGALKYDLPIATDNELGGIKIGNTLNIDSGGKVDYNLPIATDTLLGGVKIGNTLSVDSGGKIDYNLPAGNENVMGGVRSTNIVGGITINLDGTMKYNTPKTEIDAVIPDTAWAEGTEYKANNLVGYNNVAYICKTAHTSSNDFDADFALGYWSKIETPKTTTNISNGGIGYVQALVQGVTGATSVSPYVKSLTINSTNSFILPPIEVLEETPGQSTIINDLHFDNADATDFDYNADFVEFDGTMKLKTAYNVNMSVPEAVTDGTTTGYISISDEFDLDNYGDVQEISVI